MHLSQPSLRLLTPLLASVCLVVAGSAALDAAVGWRGNGTSFFPEASPPVEFGPDTNIAWRVDCGSWSWATPIVIGDLVVVQAEPHLVLGLARADGSERWRTEIDQFALMDESQAAEGRSLVEQEQAAEAAARAWGAEVQALLDELKKAGHKDWSRGKTVDKAFGGRKGEADPPPDAELATRWKALVATGAEQGYEYNRGRGELAWTEAVSQRRQRLAAEFGVYWESEERGWNRVAGEGMATPVSDGTHIFVAMANNVVACLDLAGKPVWQTFDPKPRQEKDVSRRVRRELHFIPSPVLTEELVIVAQDADRLRAYRRSDGQKAWEVGYPTPGKNVCGTPTVVEFGGRTLIVAANGSIYDPADGSVLSDGIPVCDGGSSPLVVGDVVYVGQSNKGDLAGLSAHRLAVDGDAVTVTKLWHNPAAGQSDRAPCFAHGLLFTAAKDGKKDRVACLDPADGSVITRSEVEPSGNPVYVVAGDVLIVKSNGPEFWLFKADRSLSPLGSPKVADGKAKGFGYPTIDGSLMLVRLERELIAVGTP